MLQGNRKPKFIRQSLPKPTNNKKAIPAASKQTYNSMSFHFLKTRSYHVMSSAL